jgi:LmbE family N-acetylglucosaminyl deacetylase
MMTESDILPFSISELPDGPWLVFSPHPDDETFGMGGTLLLAKEQGIDVFLITVTNGRMGGHADDDQIQVIETRKDELENASQLLGIKQLYFLDVNDREVTVDDDVIQKIQDIIYQLSPATIFFPSILEPHPDHRATAQLAACSVTEKMKSIAFYGYDISVQSPVNTLIDISVVHTRKVQVMQMYQSQLGQNNYIDVINALNKSRTYTLEAKIDYAEGFFHYKNFVSMPLAQQIYKQFEKFWL